MASLGGLSFIGTTIQTLAQRRKVKAEAAKTGVDAAAVLTDSALAVLTAVRDEAEGLRTELSQTRAELSALRRHLGRVEAMLRERGLPVPEFIWPPHNGFHTHEEGSTQR